MSLYGHVVSSPVISFSTFPLLLHCLFLATMVLQSASLHHCHKRPTGDSSTYILNLSHSLPLIFSLQRALSLLHTHTHTHTTNNTFLTKHLSFFVWGCKHYTIRGHSMTDAEISSKQTLQVFSINCNWCHLAFIIIIIIKNKKADFCETDRGEYEKRWERSLG